MQVVYSAADDCSTITYKYNYEIVSVPDGNFVCKFFGDFNFVENFDSAMNLPGDYLKKYIEPRIGSRLLTMSEFRANLDFSKTPRRLTVIVKGNYHE